MKINVFNLNDRRDSWNKVRHALHQVWIGNSEVNLPMFEDKDFLKAFENIKKKKSLKECKEILGIN